MFDQPKENYLAPSKKCVRYKVPIYFIQQNNCLFSLSPTEGGEMLTGNLGKLGQCYIFLEPDMIENSKATMQKVEQSRFLPLQGSKPRPPSLLDNL